MHILNRLDSGRALVGLLNSFASSLEVLFFDENFDSEIGSHFTKFTLTALYKAEKKQKLKLNISNAICKN